VLAVLDVARTPAEIGAALGVSGVEAEHAIRDLAGMGKVCCVAGGKWERAA